MTLTHLDLDRIEGFARVATPGPWTPYDGRGLDAPADCIDFAVVSGHSVKETARVWTEDDARFIAALDPTTVLAMITRIRELEGALTDIASHNFVRLEKEEGRTLDETAASRLYNEWHAVLNIARTALQRKTP